MGSEQPRESLSECSHEQLIIAPRNTAVETDFQQIKDVIDLADIEEHLEWER